MAHDGKTLASLRAYAKAKNIAIKELSHPGGGVTVIVPAFGGRIMYAGFGADNHIFAAPDFDTPAMWQGNYGGLRTWLSPEGGPKGTYFSLDFKNWKCPASMDPGAFSTLSESSREVRLSNDFDVTANDGSRFSLTIGRDMAVGERPTSISGAIKHMGIDFTHHLKNRGAETLDRVVDLWHLAQINPGGVIVVPTKGKPQWRNYFQAIPADRYTEAADHLVVRVNGALRFKLGVPDVASTGRIAYLQPLSNGSALAIVKRFSVDANYVHCDRPEGKFDENGDGIQLYNHFTNDDNAFAEIECHSPAEVLRPGAGQSFPIRFDIMEGSISDVLAAAGVLLERNIGKLDINGR